MYLSEDESSGRPLHQIWIPGPTLHLHVSISSSNNYQKLSILHMSPSESMKPWGPHVARFREHRSATRYDLMSRQRFLLRADPIMSANCGSAMLYTGHRRLQSSSFTVLMRTWPDRRRQTEIVIRLGHLLRTRQSSRSPDSLHCPH